MESIGLIISMVLTLMVFSYILGDNPLFKLAEHIFVGVSVAYAVLVAWHGVIVPFFGASFRQTDGSLLVKLPPALLCLFLIFKVRPNQSSIADFLGSISLAFLIGLGAALAIEGALFGTLFPQIAAVANIDFRPSAAYANAPLDKFFLHNDFLSNVVVVLGTVGTLFYFNFTYRPEPEGTFMHLREWFINFWAGIGRLMILITLGALFTNTVNSRFALLFSRIQFLVDGFQRLVGG